MDHDRQPAPERTGTETDTDTDTDTAVRPALADDLLAPLPYPDDDALADEDLLVVGGQRPSRLTRVLLALLILAVGIFVGVQVARFAGASGGGATAARASAGGSAVPRPASGSPAPAAAGEVSSIKAHTLVLTGQGASETVTFTDDTTVTQPYGHRALGVGDAVTVFGSRAADGSVNATGIVVR